MNTLLVQTLIEKNGIGIGTELHAYYQGVDISGARLARSRGIFLVSGAKKYKNGEIVFMVENEKDIVIRASDIIAINGMEPIRVANAMGFDLDGDKIVPLKKRGQRSQDDDEIDDE